MEGMQSRYEVKGTNRWVENIFLLFQILTEPDLNTLATPFLETLWEF